MAESIVGGGEDGDSGVAPTLSVVVITHNERERIEACLESVFDACAPLSSFEVVLVDSGSTDGTLEVATRHPISILQLPAEPKRTPGAGRYVGTAATTGELVLFVDGDMILEEGWLPAACSMVRETPELAGVDGHLREPESGGSSSSRAETDSTSLGYESIDTLRGVALYDRVALASVGGFDPHLESMEDIDLGYRLGAAGYDLRRLDATVANHPDRNPPGERRRRWRRGYYFGRGELFRKYLARPRLLAQLIYRTRLYLAIAGWVTVGPLATLAAGTRGLLAWTIGTVAGFLGVSKVQGTDWAVDKVVATAPVVAGTALGFPGAHPSASAYPLDRVERIQTAPPITGSEAARAT